MRHIQLSGHFKCSTLLLFALPSIGMQIVDNTYQIADGFFISNYIGEKAFEAENLIFPALLIVMYVGLMFGTGASALIAKELGEGKKERARQIFSMAVSALAATGLILSAALYFLLPTIARWVGASEALAPDCIAYGRILAFFMPFQMLSMAFHPLLVTAEKPGLGLATTIANAAANILLDWLFVAGFGWKMEGAAIATGLAWLVSAIIPMVYFTNKKHLLHFTRPCRDAGVLGKTLYNGASEMVDAVSYAVVALIFNLQLLRWMGEDGVGAYAVSEYVSGVFLAVFYGISMSIVPIVGYQLGKKNIAELRNLRKNGLVLMGTIGTLMAGFGILLAQPVSRIFVGYSEPLTALSVAALRIVALSYLLSGITTFGSSYFTGLNLGSASLAVAVTKGFIGPLAMLFLLPLLVGADGIWYSAPAAEILTLAVTVALLLWWRKRENSGKLPEADDEYTA